LRNHGHLLLAQQPLELANPLVGFPQRTHRDDIFIRRDRRGGPGFEAALPLPHHAGLMSRSRDTSAKVLSPFNSCWTTPRELHGKDQSTIAPEPGTLGPNRA
jgi:hypothetical protein